MRRSFLYLIVGTLVSAAPAFGSCISYGTGSSCGSSPYMPSTMVGGNNLTNILISIQTGGGYGYSTPSYGYPTSGYTSGYSGYPSLLGTGSYPSTMYGYGAYPALSYGTNYASNPCSPCSGYSSYGFPSGYTTYGSYGSYASPCMSSQQYGGYAYQMPSYAGYSPYSYSTYPSYNQYTYPSYTQYPSYPNYSYPTYGSGGGVIYNKINLLVDLPAPTMTTTTPLPQPPTWTSCGSSWDPCPAGPVDRTPINDPPDLITSVPATRYQQPRGLTH